MSGHFPHPFSRAREAEVIRRLNVIAARLDGWTAEIKSDLAAKYNPRQPRAPRGTPIGGQWVDSGGGNTGGGRFGVRKPAHDPWLHDAMTNKPPYRRRPEDILEEGGAGGGARSGGLRAPRAPSAPATPATPMPKSPIANQAVPKLQKLNRQAADDLQEVMIARSQGRVSAKESNAHMREVADDVEKFLGGKVEANDIKPSKSGDLVILKGDKKFRMDVKNPGRTPDRKGPDDPHFHFERLNDRGRWEDASDLHKNYFRKD